MILKSEFNADNSFEAINALAIPVVHTVSTYQELSFSTYTLRLDAYLTNTKDQLFKIAKQHESREMYSISKEAVKFKNKLNVPDILPTENEASSAK